VGDVLEVSSEYAAHYVEIGFAVQVDADVPLTRPPGDWHEPVLPE
jgi:hypothetical protein